MLTQPRRSCLRFRQRISLVFRWLNSWACFTYQRAQTSSVKSTITLLVFAELASCVCVTPVPAAVGFLVIFTADGVCIVTPAFDAALVRSAAVTGLAAMLAAAAALTLDPLGILAV